MKIVVRSEFWGTKIEGIKFNPKGPPYKPYRLIKAQLDFRDHARVMPQQQHPSFCNMNGNGNTTLSTNTTQWGCCPHHGGDRVMELSERHFLDAHNGFWDLYLTRTYCDTVGCPVQEMLLMPANQTKINVENGIRQEGWIFVAKMQACILRIELEPLFAPIMREVARFGFTRTHAHLYVMMDEAVDQNPHRKTGRERELERERNGTGRNTSKVLQERQDNNQDNSNNCSGTKSYRAALKGNPASQCGSRDRGPLPRAAQRL